MTATNVTYVAPAVRNIRAPAPLRDLPIWLVWNAETYPNETKARKVPYTANGGRRHGEQGSPEDTAKLVTFSQAAEAAAKRGMTGVGVALLPRHGLVAVDFDNCVTDGKVHPEVEKIVSPTYAEFSPSGLGVRAFFTGDIGNHKAPTTLVNYGFEVFSSSGFCTVTGNMLPFVDLLGHEDTVAPVTPEILALCEKRFARNSSASAPVDDFTLGYAPPLGFSSSEMQQLLDKLDPDMGREYWVRVGAALHHETQGGDDGFDLWHDWSAGGVKFVGEDDLRRNWDSFDRRDGSRRAQVTMATVRWMVSEAQKEVQVEQLQEVHDSAATTFEGKFPVQGLLALDKRSKASWLIKHILPQSLDPVILFGSSGAGKSFVAIDMACCIALGEPWRGHRVTQGRVLYIAAEGGARIVNRFKAFCMHNDLALGRLPIDIIAAAPNILEAEDVKELIKSMGAYGPYAAVFIDTLAQVTPGANENAGEDMGRMLSNIKAVQQVTRSTVIAIHHAGKDLSRGSRGWSGIKAAAEAQIEVVRDEMTGDRYIRIEKMKDGEDGMKFGFRLGVKVLEMDEDGDEVTSCVVEPAEWTPMEKLVRGKMVRRGRHARHVLEVMALLPKTVSSLPMERFVQECLAALPEPEQGERDSRRANIVRAIKSVAAEKDGPLTLVDNIVVFCE